MPEQPNVHDRYLRQIALPEIGAYGQQKLSEGRVLVIGAGGLGTPALAYLAAAGVGTLGIADDDKIEHSNLQRQILYSEDNVGQSKVEVAIKRLSAFNTEVRTIGHPMRVNARNILPVMEKYDVIIDATDRLETKFMLNDAAAKIQKPLIWAVALGFEAQVSVFDARSGPCLRCLYPTLPEESLPTCSQAGILGAITGIAGSLQALEAIKWFLRDVSPNIKSIKGRVCVVDGRDLTIRQPLLRQDPSCPTCGCLPDDISLRDCENQDASYRTLPPEELDNFPDALIVDVREKDEWLEDHLDGALHLPLSYLLDSEPPQLPQRSGYIVYCEHGIRSQTAATHLARAGYTPVFSVEGGLAAMRRKRSVTR